MENRKKLSLVVPVYFEQECVAQFIDETTAVLNKIAYDYEIVFVDDGSTDQTVDIIKARATTRPEIKLIELSYNHGKQAALTAGVTYATGDYLLYMDPDLQDPPEEIPAFITELEKGYDLVFGVRKEKMDSLFNVWFSRVFWYVLEKFTHLKLPVGLAVMRIFNRRFANKFLEYKEQNRFVEGIFMHIGMKRSTLPISQRPRFAGKSKFNFTRKVNLALDAIFDFSEAPLRVALKLGLYMAVLGLLAMVLIIIFRVFFMEFPLGWPSLVCVLIIGFGVQLFFMGISAIYIGKTYKESKMRPLFSIKETTNLPV